MGTYKLRYVYYVSPLVSDYLLPYIRSQKTAQAPGPFLPSLHWKWHRPTHLVHYITISNDSFF